MKRDFYDIIIIGAGPAGMAAALAAAEKAPQAKIALIEREAHIGGILKQCIHDGFGLVRFKERLTGPEYAWRYRDMLASYPNIRLFVSTFVTRIEKNKATTNIGEAAGIRMVRRIAGQELPDAGQPASGFILTFTNPSYGVFSLRCTALIAATGCRERTDRQVFIHGDRPSGIFTAGQAQAFINLKGYLPGKRFVILGSGDIGLIMARRLTLESAGIGGKVEGVYEVKSEPSGLTRNLVQCLDDYGIPLHLSTTVSRLHGTQRLEGVTVSTVDERMQPIAGTDRYIPCDTLIVSVGLIPENDILDELAPVMDERTKGPQVNQYMETSVAGLFSCGNALHVNDLVDYVSESGAIAGERAAVLVGGSVFIATTPSGSTTAEIPITDSRGTVQICGAATATIAAVDNQKKEISVYSDKTVLYQVPARVVPDGKPVVFYFRSSKPYENVTFVIKAQEGNQSEPTEVCNRIVFKKNYRFLKPPEMERVVVDTALIPDNTESLLCAVEYTQ